MITDRVTSHSHTVTDPQSRHDHDHGHDHDHESTVTGFTSQRSRAICLIKRSLIHDHTVTVTFTHVMMLQSRVSDGSHDHLITGHDR
ncbi:hypothetical protein HPP92_003227 [Vanilla planifolia]|uniref:Uncharacterized protein n=1 Tax=Vanilla planifolia TaxID=51239 RepID=A0A835VN34_VANPL|nr:hypothetical protein HPP92_003227 [Vanilla planifolia]